MFSRYRQYRRVSLREAFTRRRGGKALPPLPERSWHRLGTRSANQSSLNVLPCEICDDATGGLRNQRRQRRYRVRA